MENNISDSTNNNRPRPALPTTIPLNKPWVLLSWMVVVVLVGAGLHIDAGWIAFVACLPVTALGVRASLMIASAPAPVAAPLVDTRHDTLKDGLRPIVRKLDQAAMTLMTI